MSNQASKTYLYDAFISYRHTEPDKTIAEKLHKMLETYKIPSNIAKKTGLKKIKRVFRDRDELPTSSNLAENIQNALSCSRFLIVICSPRTSKSEWVLKEIDTFIQMYGRDKVLALLIEGEPEESFPEQLRLVPYTEITDGSITSTGFKKVEPLAADIRANDNRTMQKNLKIEMLRLISPMIGCSFDDLRQRHRERFIKKVITVSVCLSLFFLGFGSFSTWQAIRIKTQVNKTLKGQSLYLSDLSGKLLDQGDRKTAILLALEALPKNLDHPERPYVEEAEFALSESLAAYRCDGGYVGDMALEHKLGVADIILSPDGTISLTSCNDGYYYLWKTGNGSRIQTIKNGMSYPASGNVFFSKDGSKITGLTEDGIASWDVRTGKEIWNVKTTDRTIIISPDHKTIVSGGRTITLYADETGTKLAEIPKPGSDYTAVNIMTFNNSGNLLAIGTNSGDALIIDMKTRKILYSLKTDYKYVDGLAFSRDNKRLSVVSNYYNREDPFAKGKSSLYIIDCSSGYTIDTIKENCTTKLSRFSSADSNQFIYTQRELVKVYNLSKKSGVYSFTHGGMVTSLLMNDSGTLLVTSAEDGIVRFFSMSMGIEYDWKSFKCPIEIEKMEPGRGGILALSTRRSDKAYIYKMISGPKVTKITEHTDFVSGGVFSPDGMKCVTFGSGNNEVYISDVKKNKALGKLEGITGTVADAWFTSDGKYIITLTLEGSITLWDSASLKKRKENKTARIISHAISGDNTKLAIYGFDGMEVFDLKNLKKIESIKQDMAFGTPFLSQDGRMLFIAGGYSKSVLYQDNAGKKLKIFKDMNLNYASFSRDGNDLYIASDSKVYIYNMKENVMKKTITDIEAKIASLSTDYEGKKLLVGLEDKTVRIYDAKTGAFECELSGNASKVTRFLFRNRGKSLVTFGDSKDAVIWDYTDCMKLAFIKRAFDIDEGMKEILTSDDTNVLILPRYTTKMLIEEAKKQLGKRQLTEKDKAKYFIID